MNAAEGHHVGCRKDDLTVGEAVSTWSDLQRLGFDPGPVSMLAGVMNLIFIILFP